MKGKPQWWEKLVSAAGVRDIPERRRPDLGSEVSGTKTSHVSHSPRGRHNTYSRLIPDSGWGDVLGCMMGGGWGIRFSSSISSLKARNRGVNTILRTGTLPKRVEWFALVQNFSWGVRYPGRWQLGSFLAHSAGGLSLEGKSVVPLAPGRC